MAKIMYIFMVTAALLQLDVSARPASIESAPTADDVSNETGKENTAYKERSIYFEPTNGGVKKESTREIVDKIKAINDGLKKPPRQQINYNKPQTGGGFIIDPETLKKIQQAIDSGKIQPYGQTQGQQESNSLQSEEENFKRFFNSRAIKIPSSMNSGIMPTMPLPYIMPIPVVIMPQNLDIYSRNTLNNNLPLNNQIFQTRQDNGIFSNFPSFFQWPLANLFPLIINDPFLTLSQGGGWSNLFEYGQSADVCTRKQKSDTSENEIGNSLFTDPEEKSILRQGRALKRRTIPNKSPSQELDNAKSAKKVYVTRPVATKTKKKPYIVEEVEEVKNEDAEGDLRFPFNGFSWFGDKKPVVPPSPGLFINRLRVRKGGVAIAGPGGVATAGRGGTAIVGPGGLAYTQPGGLAVAGPSARVVALSSDIDLNSLVTRIQKDQDESIPLSKQPIREGKLVATGPVVYYHPDEQTSYGPEDNRQDLTSDYYTYDSNGINATKIQDRYSKFNLHLSPSALAVSGNRGSAIANPISRAVVRGGQIVSIAHKPMATAIVGAGGIAHAQSDLYVYEYTSYKLNNNEKKP